MDQNSEKNIANPPPPLKRENKPDFSTPEQFSPFFDPYIFRNLELLSVRGLQTLQLTVVFWDITRFSNMCRILRDHPQIIQMFLGQYFEEAAIVVGKYNGILDKFVGDGILAYFGIEDVEKRGSPEDAVAASLELKNTFNRIRNDFFQYCMDKAGKNFDINLKCGMHNGKVHFGLIETPHRKQITIIGEEVNLASRLVEEIALNDEIIASNEVKNMVSESFVSEDIKVTERMNGNKIKKYEEIETVYRIIGEIHQ